MSNSATQKAVDNCEKFLSDRFITKQKEYIK